MTICVIIPVYNLSSHRFENFKFLLTQLIRFGVSDIYVIEQVTENKGVYKLTKMFGSVKYIPFDIKENQFNKSNLINTFVSTIKYDYVWMIDCDVYLNFSYVFKNIPTKFHFIRPYQYIIRLSEKESEHLLKTERIKVKNKPPSVNNAFGKYSFIICKKLFDDIGGYDVNFKGWGYQDLDLVKRLPNKSIIGYTDNTAFHLYHTPAPLTNYSQNKVIYSNKHSLVNKQIKQKILKQR